MAVKFARLLGSLMLASTALAAPVIGPGTAIAQPADFGAQAEAMVAAAYPVDGPGAAVIVMRGDRVIYASGRGLADLEARRPITPDTVFRLGSIVKQFTAAVVLQLVAEGRISLDDPISRFFPDFPQPSARATVRQLLNHSSGIQDYTKIPGWIDRAGTRPFTTAELVAEVRDRPAVSEPGTRWEYNNAGYMMLGAIVEQATGQPWHEVLSQRITRPLGLRTIEYGVTGETRPAAAQGYTVDEGQVRATRGAHMSLAHAAGGLVGSVSDIARWAQALHHGRVVSPALYQEMIRPALLADGSTQPYGFGLRLRQVRGRPALVHGGAGRGLDTDSLYIPSEELFVAVFANSDEPATDPATMTRRLAALALGQPLPTFASVDVEMAAIEPLFGVYSAEDGEPLRFFGRDGRLFVAQGDGEMEALPAGGDRFFFARDALSWIRFVRTPGGAPAVEVHRFEHAEPQRATRSGAVPPPLIVVPAVLQSYVGTYATETVVLDVALADNGWLTIAPAGQPPQPLRPVSQTEFRADAGGFRVVFHPENDAVNRMTLHRGARVLNGRRTGG